jgi:hypothetical protein
MELLHKCPTCQIYIHIVCSIDNILKGEADCFYCFPSCAGRYTKTGTAGHDSLLENNPGTEGKADDVDPTTLESNQKPSGKNDDAVARSESFSKAMKDPSTSDNPELAQSLIDNLKQKINKHAYSINENPPLSPFSPSPAPKLDKNQRVLRSTPSPGSKKKKKKAQALKSTPSTRSAPSPSSTKEEPPATGA